MGKSLFVDLFCYFSVLFLKSRGIKSRGEKDGVYLNAGNGERIRKAFAARGAEQWDRFRNICITLSSFVGICREKRRLQKETVIAYKKSIAEKYAISTANAALVALNGLFSFLGWRDCRVKPFKQQRCIFRDKERELSEKEYLSLLKAAKRKGNQRLFYIMETLCNMGIRISELQFITAEAVRTGTAIVNCKGKQRKVLLPQKLQEGIAELL